MKKMPDDNDCDRGIYEDKYCFATLDPLQSVHGYTILVLKKHRADIADGNITEAELSGFIHAIHKIAIRLKERLRDEYGERPERIYVCSLCDGVEHLHVHLVPRYPWRNPRDCDYYRAQFTDRDGKEEIESRIASGELGGFWYLARAERDYKKQQFWQKQIPERVKHLEELARTLRICSEASP